MLRFHKKKLFKLLISFGAETPLRSQSVFQQIQNVNGFRNDKDFQLLNLPSIQKKGKLVERIVNILCFPHFEYR